ncbi:MULTISPECIES: hypothetical protein [Heyndrickxia]|uniref:hypothetical protein n=1 Tax=Heyndrickxia TaxID=2837504 RepID=UPI000B101A5F|nr:hypothetical protein [Heyndrickxia shackletonii]MBB2482584.1 hypothetical protein [Bacillus sp. APMAM]NEZ01905.1 hypothetical protein [Heyndrickxia shackletonii]
MDNHENEVKPMGADCDTVYCANDPCGPGRERDMEFCYEPKIFGGKLIATHCGCGYFN